MPIFSPDNWSLSQSIIAFCICATVIAAVGIRVTGVVDQLADRTGVGEAIAGAVLLGATTSFPSVVLSITAGLRSNPELVISNAFGGIAVQTLFLAVADLVYRRANLEHAAASAPNMLQNALLLSILALILLAPLLPDWTFWGIHPVTPLIFGLYIYGIYLIRGAQQNPMWHPSVTRETREDSPDDIDAMPSMTMLWMNFALFMTLLGLAGFVLEPAASNIAGQTGLSQTLVGVLFTAPSTSLPELVTSIAAVRRGALTLAVGGIIGGNAFDTLFTAVADIAYREGSLYHTMTDASRLWVTLSLFMSAILMMGLIRRQEKGIARIGSESVAIIVLYGFGVVMVVTGQ